MASLQSPRLNPTPQYFYAVAEFLKKHFSDPAHTTITIIESDKLYDLNKAQAIDLFKQSLTNSSDRDFLAFLTSQDFNFTDDALDPDVFLEKVSQSVQGYFNALKEPERFRNVSKPFESGNVPSKILRDELITQYQEYLRLQAKHRDLPYPDASQLSVKQMIRLIERFHQQYSDNLIQELQTATDKDASTDAGKVKAFDDAQKLTETTNYIVGQTLLSGQKTVPPVVVLDTLSRNPETGVKLNRQNLEIITRHVQRINTQPELQKQFKLDYLRQLIARKQMAPTYSQMVDSFQEYAGLSRLEAQKAATELVTILATTNKPTKVAYLEALVNTGHTEAIPTVKSMIQTDTVTQLRAGQMFQGLEESRLFGEPAQLRVNGDQILHVKNISFKGKTLDLVQVTNEINALNPGQEISPYQVYTEIMGGTTIITPAYEAEMIRLQNQGVPETNIPQFRQYFDTLRSTQSQAGQLIRLAAHNAQPGSTLHHLNEIFVAADHIQHPHTILSYLIPHSSVVSTAQIGETLTGVHGLATGFEVFSPSITHNIFGPTGSHWLNNPVTGKATEWLMGTAEKWVLDGAVQTGFAAGAKKLVGQGILWAGSKFGLTVSANLIPVAGQIASAVLAIDSAIELAKAIPVIGKVIEALPVVQAWGALKGGAGKLLKWGLIGLGAGLAGLGAMGGMLMGAAGSFFSFGMVGGTVGGIIGGVPGAALGFFGGGYFGPGMAKALNGFVKGGWGNLGNSLSNGLQSLLNSISNAASGYTAAPYIALGTVAGGSLLTMQVLISAFALPPFDKIPQANMPPQFTPSCEGITLPSDAPKIAPLNTGQIVQGANGSYSHSTDAQHPSQVDLNAVDILAPLGTPVFATHDGQVIAAGDSGRAYGNWVKIRADSGLVTLYAHLNAVIISNGTRVSAGRQIGTVGNSSNGTFNTIHLHYEYRLNDVPSFEVPIGCLLPVSEDDAKLINGGCDNNNVYKCNIVL